MTDPQRPEPPEDERQDAPVAATIGQSLAAAAQRSGLGAVASGETPSGAALLAAMGGVRGLCEAVLPGLVFLVGYTALIAGPLGAKAVPIALGGSVLVALVFTVVRLVARSQPTQAIAGLVGVGASAILALVTHKPAANFWIGFGIDGLYGLAILISVLVRWPLIGLAAGYLVGDGVAWRADRARYRAMQLASLCWVALFAARLIVQIPLGIAGDIAALAVTHLVMGVPLYVPLLLVTWLMVRSVYPQKTAPDEP